VQLMYAGILVTIGGLYHDSRSPHPLDRVAVLGSALSGLAGVTRLSE
jgi:hypothetical protein